jgi:two-component system chemotaxis response regulator CheY
MPVDLSKPVLVVEDSRTMGQIVRNLLMLMGFQQVDAVSDVATALTRLRTKPYRLVISDWNMQPATGQDLLEGIRDDPSLSGLPVIVVSAESHIETIRAAKNAGANGYVVKPFSGETLKQKIAAVLHSEALA